MSISAPAWSIGTSQRSKEPENIPFSIPGPGMYDIPPADKIKHPSWKIGTSSRSTEYHSIAPGPGAYNVTEKFVKEGAKFAFGLKPIIEIKNITPGPGSYETRNSRLLEHKTPAYTIRGRSESVIPRRTDIPGPGTYESSFDHLNTSVPNVKFGTSKRDLSFEAKQTPGPGTYESRNSHSSGPKCKFGTTARESLIGYDGKLRILPGPGAYNIGGELNSKGGIIPISSRRPATTLVEAAKFPGPGQYNPQELYKKSIKYCKIGTSPRAVDDKKYSENIPGPGQYNPKIFKGATPAIKIGTSLRQPLTDITIAPGPGDYEINSKLIEGPKFMFGSRIDDKSQKISDIIPGPGAYSPNIQHIRDKSPSCRIGSSLRSNSTKINEIPGPGQYDIRGNLRGPKWGFGHEKKGDFLDGNNKVPGPGAYDLPTKFPDVPKYSSRVLSPKG